MIVILALGLLRFQGIRMHDGGMHWWPQNTAMGAKTKVGVTIVIHTCMTNDKI